MKIKITVKYEAGHSYTNEWESLDLFCPACAKREVWHSTDAGDYYVGEDYMCRACGAHFYLPHGVMTGKLDWQNQQRLDALRAQPKTEIKTGVGLGKRIAEKLLKLIPSMENVTPPSYHGLGLSISNCSVLHDRGKTFAALIDAEIAPLVEALRRFAVVGHRNVEHGDYWQCEICEGEWKPSQLPNHEKNCLLALAGQQSKRAEPVKK